MHISVLHTYAYTIQSILIMYSKRNWKHSYASGNEHKLPNFCYKYLSKARPPVEMADFKSRASKAQQSGGIYSAGKEMHSEPNRTMINGCSSQFKDGPHLLEE